MEREIKIMVSEQDFSYCAKVLTELANPQIMLQTNYYYDTPDFRLNSLGNTLRVRQKNNDLVLQYKYEKCSSELIRMQKEFEVDIDKLPLHISSKSLPYIGCNSEQIYVYIGCLVTERWNFVYNQEIVFLDKNYYMGKYDCEIEIEFQNFENAKNILKLLKKDQVQCCELGKYERFVEELVNFNLIGTRIDSIINLDNC